MFKFGERSYKRMEGVNPLLISVAEHALSRSRYDMTIPWMGGLRTAQDQMEIFQAGNSKLDGTPGKESYHQSGNAVDIIPVDGGYKNNKGFNHFAQVMFTVWADFVEKGLHEGYDLEWGGFWGATGWDKPHWQLVKR